MLGPVQVLVVAVPDAEAGEQVLASLRALDRGAPVRLLDAFVVAVDADGAVIVGGSGPVGSASLFVRPDDVDLGEPAAGEGGEPGADTWDLGQVIAPGSQAVVALLEHRWATPLRDALVAAGGALAHEAWLDADDRDILEALLGS